jgi:hypothetical protein
MNLSYTKCLNYEIQITEREYQRCIIIAYRQGWTLKVSSASQRTNDQGQGTAIKVWQKRNNPVTWNSE